MNSIETETIHIKVSQTEKEYIRNKAREDGCTLSDFIRNSVLCETNSSTHRHSGTMVCLLSQLATVTNQVDDPQLRDRFVELERQLWQLTK